MSAQEIKDQIELCKKSLQKALGHMSRIEQLFKSKDFMIEEN